MSQSYESSHTTGHPAIYRATCIGMHVRFCKTEYSLEHCILTDIRTPHGHQMRHRHLYLASWRPPSPGPSPACGGRAAISAARSEPTPRHVGQSRHRILLMKNLEVGRPEQQLVLAGRG